MTDPGANDDCKNSACNREDEILIACALRFDGYRFIESTRYNHQSALRRSLSTAKIPRDLLKRFCLFFILQRILYKWGGEQLPRDGRHWWLFRTLFLSVAAETVAPEFTRPDYSENWHPYLADLPATIRAILQIHTATLYRDAP